MEWNEAAIPQIDIIDDEKILGALDSLEDNSQSSQLEKQGLLLLGEYRERVAESWYDIDLAKAWESLYITNGLDEALNVKISDHNELRSVLDDVVLLLNEQRPLAISWDDNERSIYETSRLDTMIMEKVTKKEWTKGNSEVQVNVNEIVANNNYVEELYKFTQNVKGIPVEEWDILDSDIQKPWESEEQFFKDMGNWLRLDKSI